MKTVNKLLTIAIPTYNRAELLDRQLAWIAQAIQGFESECEIYVSDNCSTDNTQEIIKKWQTKLNHITFNANKNPENLGVMPNIINCLKSAKTKYVWAIGDDDQLKMKQYRIFLKKLKNMRTYHSYFLIFPVVTKQLANQFIHLQ